ncbi:MAG: hypothetical protein KGH60_04770 [Candidatus Micrarchaeota archaeon]|nr:hypothetical protein [Candidatus Micrarchaeota archaeon]
MAATSRWAIRFIWSAVIQGALLTVATLLLFVYGSLYLVPSPAQVIAAGSAGTWLLVGYLTYIVMIISLGVTALFYNYMEAGLGRTISQGRKILVAVHLILMNIGMAGATWLLMYAGYAGGRALMPISQGGLGLTDAQAHVQILGVFPQYIVLFILATLVGAVAGGLAYILELRRKKG